MKQNDFHPLVSAPPIEETQQYLIVVDAGPLVTITPTPIVISVPPLVDPQRSLSHYLRLGRAYHPCAATPLCSGCSIGYYAYERREEWQTCALAAAYAGAFGPQSIEKPEFSYSMAVWQLSQLVGFDIGQHQVTGPTGRRNKWPDEMIKLVDENLWTRAGVAEWLASMGV
jgi:hypothetical protein